MDTTKKLKAELFIYKQYKIIIYALPSMHFGVNLKMKKPALSCCFTWIAFVELNFTVVILFIRKMWKG